MADARPLIARIQVEHGSTGSFGQGDTEGSVGDRDSARLQKLAAKNTAPRGPLHKALTDIKTTGQKALKFDILKTLGISVTIASLLKQSQVFTSSIGSIFQLLGAMIDMFLAPLVRPILIPFLRWMSRKMPDIAAAGQATADYIVNKIFPAVQGIWEGIPSWLRDNAKWIGLAVAANFVTGGILGRLGKGLAGPFVSVLGRSLGGLIKGAFKFGFMAVSRMGPWGIALGAIALILPKLLGVSLTGNKDNKTFWGFLKSIFVGNKGTLFLGGSVKLVSGAAKPPLPKDEFLDAMDLIQMTGQTKKNLIEEHAKLAPSSMNTLTAGGRLLTDDIMNPDGVNVSDGPKVSNQFLGAGGMKTATAMNAFMQSALGGFQGKGFHGSPMGLTMWLQSVFDDAVMKNKTGVYQTPEISFAGQTYQFHLTLDAGTLMKTGVTSVQIKDQGTGNTTAETIQSTAGSMGIHLTDTMYGSGGIHMTNPDYAG